MPLKYLYGRFFTILLTVIFLFEVSDISAQSFWSRTYGGANEDAGLSVIETPDSGYMVVGFTGSFGNGASDAYIIKTDSVGIFQWYKTYGGANVDIAEKIIPAFGGGYLVAGYSNSVTFDYDFWILKIDELGDTLWTKKVGGEDWDRAYSAVGTQNGSYMVVGETYSGNNQYADGLIVKIDNLGDTAWTKKFSLPGSESLKDVVRISGTRYAAVGTRENVVSATTDGFVLFFDEDGDFTDTFYYDFGFNEYINCIAISPTYEIMLGGYYHYDTTSFPKSMQVKIDTSGNVDFFLLAPIADNFGMQIHSYAHYNSDIFFFSGRSFYKTSGDHQAIMIKSWGDGIPEWLRSYGKEGPDDGVDGLTKTFDGGFLSVGYTKSFGPGTQALLMYKISPDGTNTINNTIVNIKENIINEHIMVFPNPAEEQVTFSAQSNFTLRLLDSNGKEMSIDKKAKSNQYQISVTHLATGFYFGEMKFDDGATHFEKIYILSK
jgi:hypothetical protein